MKKIVTILVAIFMASYASAEGFSILGGRTDYGNPPDGIWWQKPFPHELDTKANSIGVRYDSKRDGRFGWAGGYQHLGNVKTYAIATLQDGFPDGVDGGPNGGYLPHLEACYGPCSAFGEWFGHGNTQGFYLAGNVRFGNFEFEAGPWLYMSKTHVQIVNVKYAGVRPSKTYKGDSLRMKEEIRLSLMAGVAYHLNDSLAVRFSVYDTHNSDARIIPLWGNRFAKNLSVQYKF